MTASRTADHDLIRKADSVPFPTQATDTVHKNTDCGLGHVDQRLAYRRQVIGVPGSHFAFAGAQELLSNHTPAVGVIAGDLVALPAFDDPIDQHHGHVHLQRVV
jgi:hypothetical protein